MNRVNSRSGSATMRVVNIGTPRCVITDVDVRLVRQLDRRDSPLLQSAVAGPHNVPGRLSTRDRCVEPLYDDSLTAFVNNARPDLSVDSNTSVDPKQ